MQSNIKGKSVLMVLLMTDLIVYMSKKINCKLVDIYEMVLLEKTQKLQKNKNWRIWICMSFFLLLVRYNRVAISLQLFVSYVRTYW